MLEQELVMLAKVHWRLLVDGLGRARCLAWGQSLARYILILYLLQLQVLSSVYLPVITRVTNLIVQVPIRYIAKADKKSNR